MSNNRVVAIFILMIFLVGCSDSNIDRGTNTTMQIDNPLLEEKTGRPVLISSTSFDLGEVAYQEAEYFISGTANSFTSDNAFQPDGQWQISVAEQADYKTRIVVYRPIEAADFNGSVIVEWLNVSGGLDAPTDWLMAHTGFIRQGFAWVGVSAQIVGIEGREGSLVDLSLKSVNPERYASLIHPGDSFSYDIFSQAAQAVRNPIGGNPLAGLSVERMIASGESQSASRLLSYVNTIAPLTNLFDGYFIHSRLGSSAPISQVPQEEVNSPELVRVRDDLEVPVMMLQTETDLFLLGSYPDRQDDSEYFRLWEVAGAAHADLYTLQGMADKGSDPVFAAVQEVLDPVPGIIDCDVPINSGPQHFVVNAAFSALDQWIRDAVSPANAPRFEVAGDPAAFVVDEHGNVRGGIRTPYVDVPIATFSGEGGGEGFCFLFGRTALFSADKIAALYPDQASYVSAVSASTDQALAAGYLLEEDGALIKAAAQNVFIGN